MQQLPERLPKLFIGPIYHVGNAGYEFLMVHMDGTQTLQYDNYAAARRARRSMVEQTDACSAPTKRLVLGMAAMLEAARNNKKGRDDVRG